MANTLSYSHRISQHTWILIFLCYIRMCLYRRESFFFFKIWITQLIRSCLTFYRTLRFIVLISRARNSNITRARSIHSKSSYSLEYYFFHLCLVSSVASSLKFFLTFTVYEILISCVPVRLIILLLIRPIISLIIRCRQTGGPTDRHCSFIVSSVQAGTQYTWSVNHSQLS